MTDQAKPVNANEAEISPDLVKIRKIASRFFIGFLWVYVAVVGLIDQITDNTLGLATGLSVTFAAVATFFFWRNDIAAVTRYAIAACLTGQWALGVYVTSGLPDGFVLDAHMMFFVLNAQLVAYFCWRSVLIVNAIATVHHVIFAWMFPALIWPTNDYSLYHFLIHGGYVVLVGVPVIWLAWRLFHLFNHSHNAIISLQAAREENVAEQQAREERKKHWEQSAKQDLEDLAKSFEGEVGAIVLAVGNASAQLQNLAKEMSNTASAVGADAESASSVAHNILDNVDAVAASSKELSASVDEISCRVSGSSQAAANAVDLATNATKSVKSLSDRVEEISHVVNLISDIASQTNLLALNATIEAARAGESGKGFAVVASEVKGLASQTAKATEQIADQINAVVGATSSTVADIQNINSAISSVQSTSTAIASAIEEQGAATREIAGNVEKTAEDVNTVSTTVASLKNVAQGNVGKSQQVLDASESLRGQSENLKGQLQAFLARLQASA